MEQKTKDQFRREKLAAMQATCDRWKEQEELAMSLKGIYDDELPAQVRELENAIRIANNILDEKAKLVDCLQWYADATNYRIKTATYGDTRRPVTQDAGERAKDTLAAVEKMNN